MYTYKPLLLVIVFLLVTIICAVLATVLAAGAGETTMSRYNARTGDYIQVAGSGILNSQLKWSCATKGAVYSSSTLSNGIVYVGRAMTTTSTPSTR